MEIYVVSLISWQIICAVLFFCFITSLYALYWSKSKIAQLQKQKISMRQELTSFALSNPNPVLGVDKHGVITFANHGSEVVLSEWQVGLHEKVPVEWREIIRQVILSDKRQTVELSCRGKTYLICIVPSRGETTRWFAMDISYYKNLEFELEQKSVSDEHTNLPNRIVFKQSLATESSQAGKNNNKLGVLIVRLDDYAQVVYTYGQDIANDILLAFSKRLSEFATENSMVARLSDNEFGILETTQSDSAKMANYVQSLIDKCCEPYHIGERNIFITVCIGIAMCPTDGDQPETLTRNAQLAVNRTSSSKNRYEFFQRGMEEQLELKRELIADLHKAVANNEFELCYQPQIDIKTKKLVGCEALIRWRHPEKGLISPFFFIPAAEEGHLILAIGEWTLREACRQIVEWREQGFHPIKVAVNLSAIQILKVDIVELVKKLMSENGITHDWFSLELTESALVEEKEKAIEILKGLRALGVTVALDDFGTGYSSLNYLVQFPLDKLKIDKSFIDVIEDGEEGHAVVKGIIDLGHSMNLSIVAEGVETDAQVSYLKNNGCDIIQGYIYGRPECATKFVKFYNTDWDNV